MNTISESKGFTLIELMIVVAIIGIISAIASSSYATYIRDSKITAARSDMVALSVVIENNYMKTLSYDAVAPATKYTSYDTWTPSSDSSDFEFFITFTATDYTIAARATDTSLSKDASLANCNMSLNSAGAQTPVNCYGY